MAIITRVCGDYTFAAFDTDKGVLISAGCRLLSPADYRAHVAQKYPDTEKAAETLAIIAYIEARAAALGCGAEVEAA